MEELLALPPAPKPPKTPPLPPTLSFPQLPTRNGTGTSGPRSAVPERNGVHAGPGGLSGSGPRRWRGSAGSPGADGVPRRGAAHPLKMGKERLVGKELLVFGGGGWEPKENGLGKQHRESQQVEKT